MGPVLETISKSNEWRGDGRRVVTVHEAADASSSLMPWEDFFKAMHFFCGKRWGKIFTQLSTTACDFLLYGRHLVTDISEVLSNAKIYGFEFFYQE